MARSVWEEKVEREDTPLRRRYKEEVHRKYELFIRQARTLVEQKDLLEVINSAAAVNMEIGEENPIFQHQSLPLLDFKTRKWGGNIKSLFRITPNALWGENGENVIKGESEKDILREEKESFISKIWGNPWNLKDYFSPQHLELKARVAGVKKICQLWAERIPNDIANTKMNVERLSGEVDKKQSELEAAQNKKKRFEEEAAGLENQIDDLRRRYVGVETALHETMSN